jgi:hypothetical protein
MGPTMRKWPQSLLIPALLLLCSGVFAQSTIPSKLSGKWTTPNGKFYNDLTLRFDDTRTKAKLTVWSAMADCNVKDAPATVDLKDGKIIVVVDANYTNPCRADISVELMKSTDSDVYDGELHQGGPSAATYPILKVKVSP